VWFGARGGVLCSSRLKSHRGPSASSQVGCCCAETISLIVATPHCGVWVEGKGKGVMQQLARDSQRSSASSQVRGCVCGKVMGFEEVLGRGWWRKGRGALQQQRDLRRPSASSQVRCCSAGYDEVVGFGGKGGGRDGGGALQQLTRDLQRPSGFPQVRVWLGGWRRSRVRLGGTGERGRAGGREVGREGGALQQ
jgi:hypothetical protein